MHPEYTLGVGVAIVVFAAWGVLLAPNRLLAHRIAIVAVAMAAAIVGVGLMINQLSTDVSATLLSDVPWLSAWVIAFAALCSGVVTLTLSPLTGAGRSDLSVICVLVATAAAIPFTTGGWPLFLLPLIGFAALIAPLRELANGAEAIALLILFIGGVTALQLINASNGFGQEISASLWILTLIAAPPFHSWYFRLTGTIPLNIFAGVVILQASILASCVMVVPVTAHHTLTIILAISACISAFLASTQRDGRRAAAYIVSSQLAIGGFAEFSAETTAVVGGTFVLLTVVTATTGLVLLLGALEARSGQRISLMRPNGCYDSWPRLANAFLVLALVSAGLPLTLGYVSSDLILRGAFSAQAGATSFVLIATVLNAIAMMKMYLYLFQGSGGRPQPSDLRPREVSATFGLLLAVFVFAFELIPN